MEADEPSLKHEPAAAKPRAERPVAEREPLTVTVIEPAVRQDTAVRIPRLAERIGRHVELPRVPRWYWLLAVLAGVLLYTQLRVVAGYVMRHRRVPAPIVRVEHGLQRRISSRPVGKAAASKPADNSSSGKAPSKETGTTTQADH